MNAPAHQAGTAATTGPVLQDKVAVITGASRGIGAATARAFATAGATVVLAARSEQAIGTLADEIAATGGNALAVRADVDDPASLATLIERVLATYGRLDAAVNNAGIAHPPSPVADFDIDTFESVLRTNLSGVFLAMKNEIPALLTTGGGAIVNIASTAGLRGVRGYGVYSASKHGLIGLSKSAALDYAPQNLRINVIAPGPILNDRIAAQGESVLEQIGRAVPMGRIGQPQEIADLAVWLCSDQASFLTGTVVTVDGGQRAGSFY